MIVSRPDSLPDFSGVEYLEADAVNSDRMKVFAHSRRLYEAYWVTKTLRKPPPKQRMEAGTAIHMLLLEPDLAASHIVAIPDDVLGKNGSKSTNAWREFERANAGKILAKADEISAWKEIAASARDALHVAGIDLDSAMVEQPYYWRDPETGLACKMRPDVFDVDTIHHYTSVIVDVKTTEDATANEFQRTARSMMYGLQAVHYMDGAREWLGGESVDWWWLAVPVKPPYVCRLYALDEGSRQYWINKRRAILEGIRQCYETGDWSDVGEGEVAELSV